MRDGDLAGVMAIEEVSFPSPWTRGMFAEELGREFSDPIVAEGADGEILGYAVSWTVAGESHLLNIAEELADRIGIIHGGKLAALGTMQELRTGAGGDKAELEQIFLSLMREAEGGGGEIRR